MHIELPMIQFNSSSSSVPSISSSSSNSLSLPVPSNYTAPLRPSTASSSSTCHGEICRRLEAVDGKENKTATGSFNNFVLGPVPSKPEVEDAVAALQK